MIPNFINSPQESIPSTSIHWALSGFDNFFLGATSQSEVLLILNDFISEYGIDQYIYLLSELKVLRDPSLVQEEILEEIKLRTKIEILEASRAFIVLDKDDFFNFFRSIEELKSMLPNSDNIRRPAKALEYPNRASILEYITNNKAKILSSNETIEKLYVNYLSTFESNDISPLELFDLLKYTLLDSDDDIELPHYRTKNQVTNIPRIDLDDWRRKTDELKQKLNQVQCLYCDEFTDGPANTCFHCGKSITEVVLVFNKTDYYYYSNYSIAIKTAKEKRLGGVSVFICSEDELKSFYLEKPSKFQTIFSKPSKPKINSRVIKNWKSYMESGEDSLNNLKSRMIKNKRYKIRIPQVSPYGKFDVIYLNDDNQFMIDGMDRKDSVFSLFDHPARLRTITDNWYTSVML